MGSEVDGSHLGELRPDAVIRRHRRPVGVLDAKYKQVWPGAWNPNGPQREDLYQLAAYLSRHTEAGWGVLAYPADADRPGIPPVEKRNPWRLKSGQRVYCTALPHDIDGAARKLRAMMPASMER